MNRLILLLFFLVFGLHSEAQEGYTSPLKLSRAASIHVVTCGPGQNELYSAFGHSAIRVYDPANNIDYIYNYGVFDFDQPNFYLNFARGYLKYQLARQNYQDFLYYYYYFGRSVEEQVLNLDFDQKQKMFDYLEWNNLPENKYYYYDYFYDNCATKIRDVLAEVLEEDLVWNINYITEEKSIRDLTDDYLKFQPWGDLGIDICLGLPMDKQADSLDYMFLPDYVKFGVASATLKTAQGDKKLVKDTLLSNSPDEKDVDIPLFTPVKLFWTLCILFGLITFYEIKKGKHLKIIDTVWFLLMSLLSIFLILLWFATDHSAAAQNFNLLWAWPLHIFGLYLLLANKPLHAFFRIQWFTTLVFVLIWFFVPQHMHPALLPFLLISGIRSFRIMKISGPHAG